MQLMELLSAEKTAQECSLNSGELQASISFLRKPSHRYQEFTEAQKEWTSNGSVAAKLYTLWMCIMIDLHLGVCAHAKLNSRLIID